MAKRKAQNSVEVGRDVDGSIIQAGDYPSATINNNIDGEGLGQSLGKAISDREEQARWEEWIRESQREDSRQVMETVFVALVSGLGIGACWKFAFPWNVETFPVFVIGTTILFNVVRITNFGFRRSMIKVILISTAFLLLLKYTQFIQSWMDINQFVGTAILATLGAMIGLFVGFVQLFWHPLED
jgi:hypothetical protein